MLPRRKFLQTTVSSISLAWFSAIAGQSIAADQKLWKSAIGLNGFMSGEEKYGTKYPLDSILQFAQQERFDGVELVERWPDGPYPRAAETKQIETLRQHYERFGLQVFSIQNMADGAYDPNPETRKRWLDEISDRARFAQSVGCEHMGFWPTGDLRGQEHDVAIELLCDSFREANRIASEHGLIAGFEIEPPFVFRTTEDMLFIQRQSGMKAIYDPSHCDLFHGSIGAPHEVLEQVGVKNIAYVHLTDTDGTLRDGGTSKHLAVGDGHAQIQQSLKMLHEGGFRGWIMLDAWQIPDPYDAGRKMQKALNAFQNN